MAIDPSLESAVYNEVKTGYKNTDETGEKKIADEFFANLNATVEGYQAVVRFAYRIKSENDRDYAKSVIDAYRTKAIERVVSRYDIDVNSPYANFYSSCDAHVNHNTADLEWVEKVSGESSIVTDAIIGALVGAVVGVLAVLGIYLFDKKIKSVRVIAPEGYATVLYASKTALSKDATVKLAGKIVSGGHKKVLVTTVSEKDTAKELEVLLKEKLNELGVTDVEVCSYDNACKGDLTLACKDFGAVCVAVCHKDASAKQFVMAMEEIKETGAQYLGAVLYDTDASYLD